jgi:uncharacterized protein YeaO (DUF488 family)
VWLPNLAPSAALLAATRKSECGWRWNTFAKRYESEMTKPENSRLLDTLAALSHHVNFSVGCYCENERQCHRWVLRRILRKHSAKVVG